MQDRSSPRAFKAIVVSIVTACLLLVACLSFPGRIVGAQPATTAVALIVGHRTIHIFRVSLGAFSAEERVEGARHRI